MKELAIFAVLWSIPFWIDPVMALCLWVFPQWVGNAVTMGSGMYVQHAGCVVKSDADPVRHSNTFLSRFFNLTMFNIGYHVEHHEFPGVHWVDLPEFHERMKAELVADGAHFVTYGYYGAANILSELGDPGGALRRFVHDQHPEYLSIRAPMIDVRSRWSKLPGETAETIESAETGAAERMSYLA